MLFNLLRLNVFYFLSENAVGVFFRLLYKVMKYNENMKYLKV